MSNRHNTVTAGAGKLGCRRLTSVNEAGAARGRLLKPVTAEQAAALLNSLA